MSEASRRHVDFDATTFVVHVPAEPHRHAATIGEPVELLSDDGLRLWTPILGPSTVLLARILLAEPGRRWHIGDVAGQLGIGVDYAQRCIRRLALFGWLTTTDRQGEISYTLRAANTLTWNQLERLHPELAARYARHGGLVTGRS